MLSVKIRNWSHHDQQSYGGSFQFEQVEQLYVRALNDVQAQLPEFVPREINLCSKTVEINARRVVKKKKHQLFIRPSRNTRIAVETLSSHVLITSPAVVLEMQQQPDPLAFVNWNIINIPLAVVLIVPRYRTGDNVKYFIRQWWLAVWQGHRDRYIMLHAIVSDTVR